MPWNPAAQHMAKLDEWGKDATDRFRAASANSSGAGAAGKVSLSDRLKAAKSGAQMTAVGQRWEAERMARNSSNGGGDAPAAHAGTTSTQPPPPPPRAGGGAPPAAPSRMTAPAADPFPARPPPPPQRNSANGRGPPPSLPGRPPAVPARPDSSGGGSANRRGPPPPPPVRGGGGGGAAPPSLPPRMNNESGTAHPPPPYAVTDDDGLSAAVSGMSVGPPAAAATTTSARSPPPAPPARGNKPPVPARPSASPASAATSSRQATSSPAPTPTPASSIPALSASRHPSSATCKALEAATYFCYPTHYAEWTSNPPWFYDPREPQRITQPPILARDAKRRDYAWQGSYSTYGNDCTQIGVLQFDDLSTLWYKIAFNTASPTSFECKAAYADIPQAWDEATHLGLLVASAQGYGELVARQVESWQGTVVGDGECWTLAHQALLQVNATQQYTDYVKLFESVGRTHGHLIYRAVPGQGQWRGGDQGNIRRGDVLEWEHSQCRMPDGRTATMGNPAGGMPDHTAVVVDVTVDASRPATDPARFKAITVLEQSAGQPVHQTTIDAGQIIKGGFWVFRPVGALALLDGKVEPKWHDGEGRRGWEALN